MKSIFLYAYYIQTIQTKCSSCSEAIYEVPKYIDIIASYILIGHIMHYIVIYCYGMYLQAEVVALLCNTPVLLACLSYSNIL